MFRICSIFDILERKYKDICGPDCVRMVLDSVHDDPVRLRPDLLLTALHSPEYARYFKRVCNN
jgi:hypothetical protein